MAEPPLGEVSTASGFDPDSISPLDETSSRRRTRAWSRLFPRAVHAHSAEAGANQRKALTVADRLHKALAAVAAASRRDPQAGARLSDEPGTTVTSTAYLVHRGRSEAFTRLVEHAAAKTPGVRIALAGPGACISFDPSGKPS
ncbi:GvpL/GvpF family gas vesicle protein [Actinacidiphila glaucinigra]|uniref:GvpL/GvpF family gas vesicle protein n=1 Tax=Actinacidiphila glaucinigra TaxID=235986 RepID=UPI0033DFBA4D